MSKLQKMRLYKNHEKTSPVVSASIYLQENSMDGKIGGALSSISLSIERAPPLRNSPHTVFICSLP